MVDSGGSNPRYNSGNLMVDTWLIPAQVIAARSVLTMPVTMMATVNMGLFMIDSGWLTLS